MGTVKLPVPVQRPGENFSPMPWRAPPPLGSKMSWLIAPILASTINDPYPCQQRLGAERPVLPCSRASFGYFPYSPQPFDDAMRPSHFCDHITIINIEHVWFFSSRPTPSCNWLAGTKAGSRYMANSRQRLDGGLGFGRLPAEVRVGFVFGLRLRLRVPIRQRYKRILRNG